jgi:wyosine [tRNA(Phe)-imidazoG37] synthetase (radical SAM superfamily)
MTDTFLFDQMVFGPINSRRLGISLGINLLPVNSKLCNFDCIYCECGFTPDKKKEDFRFPDPEQVHNMLEHVLIQRVEAGLSLDAITFAGNGEPTLHPEFNEVVDRVKSLKEKYFPKAKLAVLSNASLLHFPGVFSALQKVDEAILKLDSAIEHTIKQINCPKGDFSLDKLVGNLKKFEGKFSLQTMFLKAKIKNEWIDNTSDVEVNAWLELLQIIKPELVMIYSVSRATPIKEINKIEIEELERIGKLAQSKGFNVQVAS